MTIILILENFWWNTVKKNIDKNTTEYDKEKISKGIIPSNLADNNGLLNVTGYKVLSNNICEKINSLGYLK